MCFLADGDAFLLPGDAFSVAFPPAVDACALHRPIAALQLDVPSFPTLVFDAHDQAHAAVVLKSENTLRQYCEVSTVYGTLLHSLKVARSENLAAKFKSPLSYGNSYLGSSCPPLQKYTLCSVN